MSALYTAKAEEMLSFSFELSAGVEELSSVLPDVTCDGPLESVGRASTQASDLFFSYMTSCFKTFCLRGFPCCDIFLKSISLVKCRDFAVLPSWFGGWF